MKKQILDTDKQLILMLGYLCIDKEEIKNLTQKVEILDRFGLADSEIAMICGAKEQGVRNARQRIKKK